MSVKEVYTVTCSALPDSTRVAGFRGTEGISQAYAFDIFLLVGADGNDLDLADVVGAKAKLQLDRVDGRAPFRFHGIIAAFELVHEFADRSMFHATLVPHLWQLTQTLHSRIWTKKSIKDIIKEVLEDGGLSSADYEFRLAQTYKPEEHVCQYKESDFDFISRWMEAEGIYYYFEQGDSGEKLVMTDSKSKQEPLDKAPVRFYALAGHDGSAGEALHTFTCKHHALPANVKLKDYDYAKPTLDVSGAAPVSKVGFGEISVYGHRFFTPDDGKRLAKLRAEELLARQVTYRGTGTEFHLRAGYFFELEDHPRSAFDMKYLAFEVHHVGNQQIADAHMRAVTGIESDKVYHVEVKAIPADTQFRPVRATAWPRIYGYENGTICGPATSEYAQIDDQGRYNVKFKFDESDLKNAKASTFVRMMQPHGGNPEGFHFPLRKGTEVLFTFLGGDPDRPVIAGVVPDMTNPSPITSSNHTKNVIQTGGRNRFELEDKDGKQHVTLSTPHANTYLHMGSPTEKHQLVAKTDKDSLIHTGGDAEVKTTGDKEEETGEGHEFRVGKNWTIKIGVDKKETVIGKTDETFIGDKKETTIGTTTELMVGAETSTTIATSTETKVGNKTEIAVSNSIGLTVGNATETTIGNKTELTVGNSTGTTIGNTTETHVGDKTETHIGNSTETTNGNSTGHVSGMTMETFMGAKMELALAIAGEVVGGLKGGVFIGGAVEAFVGGQLEMFAGGKHELTTEKDEMVAVKQAIEGMREATIGLANMTAGCQNDAAGLSNWEAGMKNVAAGLHMME